MSIGLSTRQLDVQLEMRTGALPDSSGERTVSFRYEVPQRYIQALPDSDMIWFSIDVRFDEFKHACDYFIQNSARIDGDEREQLLIKADSILKGKVSKHASPRGNSHARDKMISLAIDAVDGEAVECFYSKQDKCVRLTFFHRDFRGPGNDKNSTMFGISGKTLVPDSEYTVSELKLGSNAALTNYVYVRFSDFSKIVRMVLFKHEWNEESDLEWLREFSAHSIGRYS